MTKTEMIYSHLAIPDAPIAVHLAFHPPDKKPRDEDNMLASMKAALDGIAMALGVNDRWFRLSHEVGEAVKGGSVEISVDTVVCGLREPGRRRASWLDLFLACQFPAMP
jgi:hypothetical protein